MDLKKLASDQLPQYASPSKKLSSGFGLLLAATFIVVSILVLDFSFKAPFLAPVFQGLNSLSHFNGSSSSFSWSFSFPSVSSCCKNDSSVDLNLVDSEEISGGNELNVPKIDKNVNFIEGTVPKIDKNVNFTNVVIDGNVPKIDKNVNFTNVGIEGNVPKIDKNVNFTNVGIDRNVPKIDKNVNFNNVVIEGDVPKIDKTVNFTNVVIDGNVPKIDKNMNFTNVGIDENVPKIDKDVNFTNVVSEGNVLQTGNSLENGKNDSISIERQNGITNGALGNSSRIDNNGDLFVVENSSNARNGRSFYRDCDIYDGEWVRDYTKPYYQPGSCPYIDRDFDCHLNKRPDDAYVKWKWQPYACDIPSFNATDFLERLRGQSLVFVGDSLNRNMWESLVCMLRASVRNKKRVFEISGRSEFKKKGFYAFRFEDYNCSVDFVGSPFLVRESSFKGVNGSFDTLRLDLMDPTTSMYNDADIIIFNTGHWWTHEKTSRGEDYYQEGDHVHSRLKVLEAYKRALYTWARWVDNNVDANRTQVIFRGYSVTHFRGGPWNSGGQCHKETEPIFDKKHLAKYPSKMKVLEHVLRDTRTPVIYMNISRLTDYRKDAHPSVYRVEGQSPVHAQDCSHWCLPGVPDTWNELLYASLLKSGRGSWGN